MIDNSIVKLKSLYSREYFIEHIIISEKGNHNTTEIKLNPKFMPHLEKLYKLASETNIPFLTMLSDDLLSFKSSYSQPLFMELRRCSRSGGCINEHKITTRNLKYLFGLDETAYVNKNGRFDRHGFEKRVLIPALEGILKTKMIDIIPDEKGNLFGKEKYGKTFHSYVFKYKVWTSEQIAARKKKEENH